MKKLNIRLRLWFGPSNVVLALIATMWLVERFYDQLDPVDYSTVIGISFTAFAAWICSVLTRADFYASRIDGALEFYQARLSLRGVKLEQSPGESDDAPCERHYRFLAPTVRIELGAIRSWRLMRAIYHQKVSLSELEAYSTWESAKLPTI